MRVTVEAEGHCQEHPKVLCVVITVLQSPQDIALTPCRFLDFFSPIAAENCAIVAHRARCARGQLVGPNQLAG